MRAINFRAIKTFCQGLNHDLQKARIALPAQAGQGHTVHVAGGRGVGRVEVGVRVHPDQAHPVLEEAR